MKYYVNKAPDIEDEYHEIHDQKCFWISRTEERIYLGEFYGPDSCCQAVVEALKIYNKVHGCEQCCCDKCSSYALYDYCEL